MRRGWQPPGMASLGLVCSVFFLCIGLAFGGYCRADDALPADKSPGEVSAGSRLDSADAGANGSISFQRHTVAAESEYGACAAVDVNRDGRLDIVSGGWWYEAPAWKRRFLRDVEVIRGRFDDYSNLPLDVDRDGRVDLISGNYRSRTLYWVRQPEQAGQAWTRHVIAQPGPMETARLVDVDGDGRLDVLPNGVKFAAWWELSGGEASSSPNWIRHDLPEELGGHGIGAGDIDDDGRLDLVCPRGWARGPSDPRRDRWLWSGEFQLHRDAGIPILVHDVDDDGDADLIWGRGHQVGVYWLEQRQGPEGTRRWLQHTIDTSITQAHSLLLGDLDNDGRKELVVGMRYLGHDGRDVGEFDPRAVYWYRFQPRTRSWSRGVVSSAGRAAVGLDPKLVDLDGDGDLDVLLADRSGLYWCENLFVPNPAKSGDAAEEPRSNAGGPSKPSTSPVHQLPHIEDHTELLVFPAREPPGDVTATPGVAKFVAKRIRRPEDWGKRRADVLVGMQAAMGPMPTSDRRVPLEVKTLRRESTETYERITLSLLAEPGDRVPAFLLVPKNLKSRAAAMLCLHQTTAIGKREPAGLGGRPSLHYAHELAGRGFVCLVPDYPSFGDYDFDFRRAADRFSSGTMKAVWNNLRCVDLLESLPHVDPDRIGVIGHSLGGHNALFTAAFDQRLRAVVTSCGFTAFRQYYGGKLAGWTSDRYMPLIRTRFGNDPAQVPFDFHEVLAAIAPRAIFVNAPLRDGNFAVAGVKEVEAAVRPVYNLFERPGSLRFEYPDSGHDFPDSERTAAYDWLAEQLK